MENGELFVKKVNNRSVYNKSRVISGLFLSVLMVLSGTGIDSSRAQDLVSQVTPAHAINHQYERLLMNALENISNNNIDEALSELRHLIRVEPNFKLAQLIYGDLLLSRSRPITDFGSFSALPHNYIAAMRDEVKVRWQHHVAPPSESKLPYSLVQLSNDQKYVIAIDLEASRLYLFQNRDGIPHLFDDFYVSIGKEGIGKFREGDQKTPTGVYFIKSFISPEELPDFYGDGAFPIDYPNPLDRRYQRNGYGIWLHGTPLNTYSRPPRDSNGCVVLSNQDLQLLKNYITIEKTPVILARRLKWIPINQWHERKATYTALLEKWRTDWESLDTDRYLSHYSKDYHGLGKDYESWVAYKHRVNAGKKFIKVTLTETSLFLYPGEKDLLVITFVQDYESNNFRKRFLKRQYWQQNSRGEWKIIYEGSLS